MKKYLQLFILFLGIQNLQAQPLQLSTDSLHFGTVITGTVDSVSLTLSSTLTQQVFVLDIDFLHQDFWVKDSSFSVFPGQPKLLWLYFKPRHNITLNTELIIKTGEAQKMGVSSYSYLYDYRVNVMGTGQYADTYYSSTQELSEEALKAALKSRLTQGYVSLGYNTARDKMFMEIDNWKTNGRGASLNTTQCIYTGRMVLGYNSRSEAQNSPNNLNTEHTWPQSMFNSNDPMVSDLHHLFITDNTANSQRGNDPFTMVGSSTWAVGGSKSNGSGFEPRNEQKGRTARAMLYFITRYGNLGSFMSVQQENTLRQWCSQFPPDSIDRRRNDDVALYQKNRNPFVDHPEFLERINTLTSPSSAAVKRSLVISRKSVQEGLADGDVLDTFFVQVVLSASGNTDVNISNIRLALNGTRFQLKGPSQRLVKAGGSELLQLFLPLTSTGIFPDTLIINSDDPNQPVAFIPLNYLYSPMSVQTPEPLTVQLFPNPAGQFLQLCLPDGEPILGIDLIDPVGRKFSFMGNQQPVIGLNLKELSSGVYFVLVHSATRFYTGRVLKEQ